MYKIQWLLPRKAYEVNANNDIVLVSADGGVQAWIACSESSHFFWAVKKFDWAVVWRSVVHFSDTEYPSSIFYAFVGKNISIFIFI